MATEALNTQALEARSGEGGGAAAAVGTLAAAFLSAGEAFGQDVPAGDLGRRAATHLLNRLGYGPRPGDIDRVMAMGLDRYILQQLDPDSDPDLERRLDELPTLGWNLVQSWDYYLSDQRTGNDANVPNTNYIGDLTNQLRAAQLVRAVHSKNQLHEFMTWFWFNHFNVNINDDQRVRVGIHDYEAQLRTHALGKFYDLLNASAHHPAMMAYLDNYLSTISRYDRTGRLTSGLNENYGRELLELHTVGVNAGYAEDDVYNAASVLTGWGIATAVGRFQFQFTANNHDPKATTVFGLNVAQGLMQDSGEQLLKYLAAHPKTAEFISSKLVRYFVADDPPADLVKRVAETYMSTDGDISRMVKTIVGSREFWNEAFGPGKYKTPFQYVASTLRAVDADLRPTGGNPRNDLRSLQGALTAMGQPQYQCIPPTGWSDKGAEWMDPTSQVNRMNFALDLVSNVTGGDAKQPLAGVFVDIPALVSSQGVSPQDAAGMAAFFNREIFGNRLSPATLAGVTTLPGNGTVPLANRVVGLMLAGPEAQGR
jgi:uncharacterized protein (DUF1800 family)